MGTSRGLGSRSRERLVRDVTPRVWCVGSAAWRVRVGDTAHARPSRLPLLGPPRVVRLVVRLWVLRSCDMEYVMLHLIYSAYLMPGEGQPTAACCLCCLIPEIFLLALIIGPHNDFHSHLDLRSWHFANDVLDAPSLPYRECSVAVRHPLGHVLYFNKL